MRKEIKLQDMPLMRAKYCKMKGTYHMIDILKSNISTIRDDALSIQQSIENEETLLGLDKKKFKLPPNLDDDKDFNIKCNQFESLLDSFEEEIKILKIEKERKGQVENLIKDTKVCKVKPENEENVEDKLEKMNTLNRRLSIFPKISS
jgi:hypothetical protein